MFLSSVALWTSLLSTITSVAAYTPASTLETDLLAAVGLFNLAAYQIEQGGTQSSCSLTNVAIRQEWSTLSSSQRIAYSNAVLKLQSLPSKSPTSFCPGCRSRYDDFVAVHINQTLTIHGTANFLSWHRYFTWSFEQALRNEAGYQGWQPYWNWGKSAFDPINSPYMDGSATSMRGNGVYEAHNCTEALPTGLNCIPPGVGGGCVKNGPFANMVVNLGPVAATLAEPEDVPQNGSGLNYNPRCMKRDISEWVSSQWNKDNDSYALITENNDVLDFQNTMQGNFAVGFYGVHTGGHFTYQGDPAGDLFTSPGDPMFWLHHGQIDRTWWIWQNQDLSARQNAIAGTITLDNQPPSRNGVLTDILNMGVNAPTVQIKDVMSTLAGPLCYIYV